MAPHASGPTRRGLLAGALAASSAAACRTAAPADQGAIPDERARQDLLLGDLKDQSESVEPITEEERKARRARTGAALAAVGFQALVCEPGPTMTWLSGVAWHRSERAFLLLVFADGSHAWLVPAFEAAKARLAIEGADKPGGDIATWDEHEYASAPLAALLRERRVERAAIEPQIRWFLADRLAGEFGAGKLGSGAAVVRELRTVKDAHELRILRRANELTKQALARVAQVVHAGMTTGEVAALVDRAQVRLGLSSPWNLTLAGPAAAYPHGETSRQRLALGDLLLVDTGGTLHGYQSDITRTWVAEGRPREREIRAWHAVRTAQERAFEAIRPGVECRAIDRVARASIAEAGWGDGYSALTHRLGHGIGLEGHEDPYFDGGSDVVLRPGMTLSNEPGIYVLREFGVRIEDIVAVTESGADVFGAWQADPLAP
jgi:Xaa-Pro dipeptidase